MDVKIILALKNEMLSFLFFKNISELKDRLEIKFKLQGPIM